jgi:hypothetical protein
MSSLLSFVVLAGEHIGFGLVPHRVVAGGLDVEAVVVNQAAAEHRAHPTPLPADERQWSIGLSATPDALGMVTVMELNLYQKDFLVIEDLEVVVKKSLF